MTFTDQIGHTFELDGLPNRIISVVPSQTELLY
ncbi:MAG: cobalamin-binding protein, partial [Vicingaceae bacterium]